MRIDQREEREPGAVICGSFRRDRKALRRDFQALLDAGCAVISPADIDFVSEVDGFVFAADEAQLAFSEVERRHLRAMEEADFVWLHCPEGYVGRSAAMELGFARALGLRVFATDLPEDRVLADTIERCDSPRSAVALVRQGLGEAPSHALLSLQSYYARAAEARGWAGESSKQTIELLKGELEELESAMASESPEETALEIADVQLYLVHLANILEVDLGAAVQDKERINSKRFDASSARLAA